MAQKSSTGHRSGAGDKLSKDAQEKFINSLLMKCKSEMSDTNDGL